jgi:hypothetical protein
VDDCDRTVYGRGLCALHWTRMRRHGSTDQPVTQRGTRGAANHLWRGDDVGYNAMHARIRSRLGSARDRQCVGCGGPAHSWSYDHADPDERTATVQGMPRAYSIDITHYVPRCKRCHSTFDHSHHRLSPMP